MIRNYIAIILRILRKEQVYSLLNITGLSLGLASCMLILIYMQHELNYDQHHANKDQLYRVVSHTMYNGDRFNGPNSPAPMLQAMISDYPEVIGGCRLRGYYTYLVGEGESVARAEKVLYADSSFFEVFTVPLVAGDQKTALNRPNHIAISASLAARHFKDENPLGKSLRLDGEESYQISAVYEDFPTQSHIQPEMLISMASMEHALNQFWISNNYYTYALLAPEADVAQLSTKLDQVVDTYIADAILSILGADIRSPEGAEVYSKSFSLQNIADIHLESNYNTEIENNGNMSYVILFGIIASFILLIACINYMNLATARASKRGHEVGIRKVLGSGVAQLSLRFFIETTILTLIAAFLSIGLLELALPYFNQLTGMSLDTLVFRNPALMLQLLGICLLIILLAGSYPALIMSRFKLLSSLKGSFGSVRRGKRLRSALVVVQFSISTILISATLIIYQQLDYMQNKDLGFDKEQVLLLKEAYALEKNMQPFKEEVLRYSFTKNASYTSYLPASSSRSDMAFWKNADIGDGSGLSVQTWNADDQFAQTMQFELVAGRYLDTNISTDTAAILINETTARLFGFEEPLGAYLYTIKDLQAGSTPENILKLQVVGVVRDFHFNSMRMEISPLMVKLGGSCSYMAIRLQAGEAAAALRQLEATWQEMAPDKPFEYAFLDEQFARFFEQEQRSSQLLIIFTVLTIVIACLGLFGLVAFTAEQRTKEIGIRKVLGANIGDIFLLLSRDFALLIGLALIAGIPVSYFLASDWLSSYAYSISISPLLYFATGLLIILIAALTMSFQSVKVARANPIDSLRYE